MSAFFSLVGLQPSAVAVALATWIGRHGTPGVVQLFATPATEVVADRLVQWARAAGCARVDFDVVSARPDEEASAPPVVLPVVRRWLDSRSADEEILWYADPGPKTLAALLARDMPSHVVIAHADDRHLCVRRRGASEDSWEALPLGDLGLETLMGLYGLTPDPDPAVRLPADVRAVIDEARVAAKVDVRVGIRLPGRPTAFAVAYELRGRLHLLTVIERPEWTARGVVAVEDLIRLSRELNRLVPRIVLYTDVAAAARHAANSGIEALRRGPAGLDRLRIWLQGNVASPGSVVGERAARVSLPPAVSGGRSDAVGPGLITCLGLDPAATLIALATHRPGKAWVVFDARTPAIAERAAQLRDAAHLLPVRELAFVTSDLHGTNVRGSLEGLVTRESPIRIDVTAGTKGQACALAQLTGAELWTMDGGHGIARRLDVQDVTRQLDGPPLLSWAWIGGGPLSDPGIDVTRMPPEEKTFWSVLAEYAGCVETTSRAFNVARSGHCPHGQLRVSRGDGGVSLEVRHRDRRAVGTAEFGGRWLEKLAAAALVLAQADEVRLNLWWPWSEDVQRAQSERGLVGTHRREIDVVARFRHQVVVVECKGDPHVVDVVVRKQIEAKAQATFGRLAVPVVVRPGADPGVRQQSRSEPQRSIVLGLSDLADPGKLRHFFDRMFVSRSTLTDR